VNTTNNPHRRTWLAWGLATMASCTWAKKPDRPEPADEPASASAEPGSETGNAAKPNKPPGSGLTVRVTGSDGKPVAQADVRFKFASGADLEGRTNAHGIVQVEPPSDGTTKVRVVAVGWDSGQGDIVVKRGKPSQLSIQLKRQED
jgi:hypothetical protein